MIPEYARKEGCHCLSSLAGWLSIKSDIALNLAIIPQYNTSGELLA